MKTIYKYAFYISQDIIIEMPVNAQILSIGLDPLGDTAIWAKVDTEDETMTWKFSIRGTGQNIEGAGTYVQSFNHGQFVWHVFRK